MKVSAMKANTVAKRTTTKKTTENRKASPSKSKSPKKEARKSTLSKKEIKKPEALKKTKSFAVSSTKGDSFAERNLQLQKSLEKMQLAHENVLICFIFY
jgi:hypothetical protein